MAGPVNHSDMSDLLASVRRLVSENVGAVQAVKKAEPVGCLVLTPDLRVEGDALIVEPHAVSPKSPVLLLDRRVDGPSGAERKRKAEAPLAEIPPTKSPEMKAAANSADELEATVARLEAAIMRHGSHDWEPDGGETFVKQPHVSNDRVAIPRLEDVRARIARERARDFGRHGLSMPHESEPPETCADLEQISPSDDDPQLRRLVAQLVRDELRGAVGLQISDRLRRLVRDEISATLKRQT